MKLVVVESPSKAKTIEKYLGSSFQVLASYGHIADLPSKNGSVDPDQDFAMHYEVSPDSVRHLRALTKASRRATHLYLATDPDREGEAIAWHVVQALKEEKALPSDIQISRVSFNAITKKAVSEAMQHPRPLDMDLVNAQQARRALDYLVGFTLSPLLWRKLRGCRSAGRVQSVALRLICERESEIERFVSREYWSIKARFLNEKNVPFQASLTMVGEEKLDRFSLSTGSQVEALLPRIEAGSYRVVSLEKKQQRRFPAPPFTTSSLQQEASRKLGFSAKQTMQLAQRLYEGITLEGETVGLITYMRTDGVQVAPEAIEEARRFIRQSYGDGYVSASPRQYQTKAKNAQEAHEAIRPTRFDCPPERLGGLLSPEMLALYGLVWKRMIASQMHEAVLDMTAANLQDEAGQVTFRATGSVVVFDGFYSLYREGLDDQEDEETSRLLPELREGGPVVWQETMPLQHHTEPPPRYGEASLVKKLEELGIGRPSTYASILSVLQDRSYVRLEKKRFYPEERGRILTIFLEEFFGRYVAYDFTAHLEEELDAISNGTRAWKEVLRVFWDPFHDQVEQVAEYDYSVIFERLREALHPLLFPPRPDGSASDHCPQCQKGLLLLKMSRFGAFVGCSDYPECRYTRPLDLGGQSQEDGDESGGLDGEPWPRILGTNPEGATISVRKGPYGFYLQADYPAHLTVESAAEAVTESEVAPKKRGAKASKAAKPPKAVKPKRQSLPSGFSPQEITLEQAIGLLSLPRLLGHHPESGKEVLAGLGRFGPFLLHDGQFFRLPPPHDMLSIELETALPLLHKTGGRKTASPVREVIDPETGAVYSIYEGKFGPYVVIGDQKRSLPKIWKKDEWTDKDLLSFVMESGTSKGAASGESHGKKKRATASKPTVVRSKKMTAAGVKKTTTAVKKTSASSKKPTASRRQAVPQSLEDSSSSVS
jgi:DNA topoisomerase-1